MKKVLLFLCVFAMCVPFLMAEGQMEPSSDYPKEDLVLDEDGCASNPWAVESADDELVMWSLFGGGDGNFLDQMVRKYNATNPAYRVKVVKLQWGSYYTKLMTAVAAKKGPDIGVCHVSKLPEMVDNGAVVPLDAFAAKAGLDWSSLNPNNVESTTFYGEKYAVPLDTHAEVLFYNKDLVEKAGMLNEDGTITIENNVDQFDAFMGKLRDNLPEGYTAMSFPQKGDEPWRLWWIFYFQMGGERFISEDGTTFTLDKEKAVTALKYVNSWYEKGFTPSNLEGFVKYFQSGKGATFLGGVWCTGIFEQDPDMNFGVMEVPCLFGKKANWGDSHTLVLPMKKKRDDAKSKAAVEFLKFVSEEGATWAKAGHIPANLEVFNSQEFKELPYRSDYIKVADTVVYFGNSPDNWTIKSLMIEDIEAYLNNLKTAEEAIDSMEEQISALF